MNNEYEVIVVGGGPAGLSAALYLARYQRRTAVFDTGHGRSSWAQINHNYLGFPGGIAAAELRERGRQQVAEYEQVTFLSHKVERMWQSGGLFYASGQAGEWCAQAVILCTGVIDHFPHFPGWEEYVGRSMFWCITCDGFNCQDERVVVTGGTNAAASLTLQLTRFTPNIILVTDGATHEIDDKFRRRLERANIPLLEDEIRGVVGTDGKVEAVLLESGLRLEVEQIFNQHGSTPNNKLARDLGVLTDSDGYLGVDTEQKTNVPGVYAAGDVTRLHSHQIATAVHEGAQAASAANYFLYPPELKDE